MKDSREPRVVSGVHDHQEVGPDAELADLLERIRRGDGDAFEQVAREQGPRLFRLALRLCSQRADAEDLVQETLLKGLPALKRFEGRSSLATYLTRAMGNLWKNRLRSRSRSRMVDWFRGLGGSAAEDETDLIEPAADLPDPQQHLERREEAVAVQRALRHLEPTRRWTLLLREVEDLSYEEIASVTDVPVGTVRSRIARARAEMRHLLESSA
ncbi:MAG: sigma-70 family RNA polymerase sigma factor [Acidobacteriota bacterium]|nr:sigma-70 family RNA polymerase sigma factor [Acidobacteriota bacterium]MDH3786849.1 sigma-70 family RNA polymerase sigma factor [Acidobacteriota bacterium]